MYLYDLKLDIIHISKDPAVIWVGNVNIYPCTAPPPEVARQSFLTIKHLFIVLATGQRVFTKTLNSKFDVKYIKFQNLSTF